MFKKTTKIFKTIFEKESTSFRILSCLMFLLPFDFFLISPTIILLSLVSLFYGNKSKWKYNFITHKGYYVPLILLYILHVLGVLWSVNVNKGLEDLGHKLSLIIFPVIIPFVHLDYKRVGILFKIFVLANTITVIVCIVNTFWRLYIYEDPQHYKAFGTYHSVFLHRSYYAMYLCISLLFLFFRMKDLIYFNDKRYPLIGGIIFFLLVTGVILSLSKAGFIILLMLLILFITKYFISKSIFLRSIFALGTLLLLFGSGKMISERFMDVYIALKQPYELNKTSGFSSSQLRLMLWESSFKAIENKPILGHGTGSVKDILRRINIEKNFKPLVLYKEKMNSHNQFLDSYVSLGIMGFILTICIFLLPAILSVKNGYFFPFGLILIIFINCMWESMFERQSGIILIILFMSLLPYYSNNNSFVKD